MDRIATALKASFENAPYRIAAEEFRTELIRKSIHMLIALVPMLASIDKGMTLGLLGTGTLAYTYLELLRNAGHEVVLVSKLTLLAQRNRDAGRFVLGPVTLGLGAMTALLLYPAPAAAIAIYALAFGDSFASLVGKRLGRIRIPFTGGKSFEGTFACFLVVTYVSFRITGRTVESIAIGAAAAILEMLPSRDFDNILMPIGTGYITSLLIV